MILNQHTIYIRFSTYEQEEGTSIKRQREDCTEVCTAQNWGGAVEIIDRGKSAFKGENREIGAALATYLDQALAGERVGHTLVVERIDRLSRRGFDDTYRLISDLTAAGVTVATFDGREIYRAGVPLQASQIMVMVLLAERAHEESKTKAVRVRKAKQIYRDLARSEGRSVTSAHVPWVKVSKDKMKRTTIEARAEVVRTIFEKSTVVGATQIVRWLHDEKIEPWCQRKRKGDGPAGWHTSYIKRLLKDRSVLGEYQPHKFVNGVRVQDGPPILGYYEQIVSHELFERVNLGAPARKAARGGAKSKKVANLVSGLARCRHCNGPMSYKLTSAAGSEYQVRGKTYVRKNDDAALRCSAAHRNAGCSNRSTVSYHTFEQTLLDACLHIALEDEAFGDRGEAGRVSKLIAERRRLHEIAAEEAKNAMVLYSSRPSPERLTFLDGKEDERDAIAKEIAKLEEQRDRARGRASDAEHLRRVADVRENLHHEDMAIRVPARLKVAQALHSLIEFIDFDQSRTATISLAKGLAALQINGREIVTQANALAMFRGGDYSALGENISAISAAGKRIERTLIENGTAGYAGAGPDVLAGYIVEKIKAGGME